MLFKKDTLEKIKEGQVDVAFRMWKKPTVKAGGTLITRIGQLGIESVAIIDHDEITDDLTRRAGFQTKEALLKWIKPDKSKKLYMIKFHLKGEDPRVALRENDQLSEEDIEVLLKKLVNLDKRSKHGPWTQNTLQIIHHQPATLSTILAEELGFERFWLKTQIRKLKALGLTISLGVGYKISPRGEVILQKLQEKNPEL